MTDSPTLDEAAIRADERRRLIVEGLLAIPETRAIIERTAHELAALAAEAPERPAPRCPNCDSGKRWHRGFAAGDAPIPCGDPWHDERPA